MKFWRHFNSVKRMCHFIKDAKWGYIFLIRTKRFRYDFSPAQEFGEIEFQKKKKNQQLLVTLFLFTPVQGLITTIDRKLLVNLSKNVKYCSTDTSLSLCRGSRVEGSISRVEGTMSRVEASNFFIIFFFSVK